MNSDGLTRKPRVLIIGGRARSLVNFRWPLVTRLADSGYQVIGCAGDENSDVARRFRLIGGEYYPVLIERAGLNPLEDLRTYLHLAALIRNIAPDIVLAYTIKPVIYGLLAASSQRVPRRIALITGVGYAFTESVHRSLIRITIGKIAAFLYRKALKKANHVFFQNPDDQQLFYEKKLLSTKTSSSVVNGSGVDLSFYSVRPLPTQPIFLLIARLLHDKGVREYVAAARLVKMQVPDARFLLAGPLDSNPSAISQSEIDSWVQDGTIKYLGALSDVRSAIESASVYVLPSYREGTPRTVLEAMSMGRPIITTTAPGCKETVIHGINGLLVPPRDVQQLAAAMRELAISSTLREQFGNEGRRIAIEKYDAWKVADSMLQEIITCAN